MASSGGQRIFINIGGQYGIQKNIYTSVVTIVKLKLVAAQQLNMVKTIIDIKCDDSGTMPIIIAADHMAC